MISPTQQRAAVYNLIGELQDARFWGTVELQFNSGNLVAVKKTQSVRPEDLLEQDSCEAPQTKTATQKMGT